MPDPEDKVSYAVLDHLRVAEKMIRLVEQLAHGPNSCDHRLVHSYSLQAMGHLQAAQRMLNKTDKQHEQ